MSKVNVLPISPEAADNAKAEPSLENNSTVFQYLIAEKNKVVVITLIGTLGARFEGELQKCLRELDNMEFTIALVNMREVSGVDSYAINFMAQAKKLLRKKTTNIAICGVKPSIKDFLLAQGVLSKTEVFNNVKEALMRYTSTNGASGKTAA